MSENTKTYLQNKIDGSRKIVERWKGADAKIAELTSSHTQLSILLTFIDKTGNLLLKCFPLEICAPISWKNANLGIEVVLLNDQRYGVRIYDMGANVEITADEFQVSENVKKWWSS